MSWQIRVRDYNTFVANILFFSLVLFQAVFFYSLLFFAREFVFDFVTKGTIVLFFLLLPVIMSMTHQTSIIAYRLTEKGYEKISWKPQIDSVKPVMKWTAIISGVAVLVSSFFNPYFLLGAVGPAGFGLIALAMGNSKGYQKLVRAADQINFSWNEVDELVLWRKRNLIGARSHFSHDDGRSYDAYMTFHCRKGEVEDTLHIIRKLIPSTPFNERKLEVFEGAAF